MDIQQLVTLQKLAKEQSFSRASKELGITQPTATMRIQALEKEVGETLIIRTGQKALLTPAGEKFLSYAERAVQVLQSGKDHLMTDSMDNQLTIAGTPTFNTFVLPQLLQTFQNRHPKCQSSIHTGSTEQIVEMILDGVSEIGFIRDRVVHPKLFSYSLYPEELRLVVPITHRFAAQDYVTLVELKHEKIIIYRRSSATWSMVQEHFNKESIKPNITMELDHIVTVKLMVLSGQGIGFLPTVAIKEELANGKLATVAIEGAPILRHTSILIPKRKLSSILTSFVKHVHRRFDPLHIPAGIKEQLQVY